MRFVDSAGRPRGGTSEAEAERDGLDWRGGCWKGRGGLPARQLPGGRQVIEVAVTDLEIGFANAGCPHLSSPGPRGKRPLRALSAPAAIVPRRRARSSRQEPQTRTNAQRWQWHALACPHTYGFHGAPTGVGETGRAADRGRRGRAGIGWAQAGVGRAAGGTFAEFGKRARVGGAQEYGTRGAGRAAAWGTPAWVCTPARLVCGGRGADERVRCGGGQGQETKSVRTARNSGRREAREPWPGRVATAAGQERPPACMFFCGRSMWESLLRPRSGMWMLMGGVYTHYTSEDERRRKGKRVDRPRPIRGPTERCIGTGAQEGFAGRGATSEEATIRSGSAPHNGTHFKWRSRRVRHAGVGIHLRSGEEGRPRGMDQSGQGTS